MAAATADTKKRLALAIHDFLGTSLKDGTISADDAESVEIAQQCIADTFHVDPTDEKAMKQALDGQSLLSIFGVYEKLKGRGTASTEGSSSAKEARPATPQTAAPGAATGAGAASGSGSGAGAAATPPNPEAEKFKSEGNAAMQAKDYPKAIECYSKALNLAPLNAIYLSNRAAAYSASNKHAEASTDAEMAVAADPKYTKAWSRLGLARFALGDAKGSMEAYGKGIEYEGSGGSPAMKRGYETAKKKVEEEENGDEADAGDDAAGAGDRAGAGASPGGAGGMPDLSSLAGMFGGGGRGGGGGMPDLSSIMSNPMFANMAQNLMSNPDMMNRLMSNPQLRQMAESFGGGGAGAGADAGEGEAGAGRGAGRGGGGMPDLAGLMNDPNIAEMARNLMGGRGGGAAGGGAGGGRGA